MGNEGVEVRVERCDRCRGTGRVEEVFVYECPRSITLLILARILCIASGGL